MPIENLIPLIYLAAVPFAFVLLLWVSSKYRLILDNDEPSSDDDFRDLGVSLLLMAAIWPVTLVILGMIGAVDGVSKLVEHFYNLEREHCNECKDGTSSRND